MLVNNIIISLWTVCLIYNIISLCGSEYRLVKDGVTIPTILAQTGFILIIGISSYNILALVNQ